MMIRGDQHVDDWAEVAVDYLDGRLDQQTRMAVEAHLSGCTECAARLRKQQFVVRFLQETALDDPPEDLEYRSIGELVFPSPGGQPLTRPVEVRKPVPALRWYRGLRAWAVPTVAVIALIAAVVGYNIARSGSNTNTTGTDSKAVTAATVVAGSATTAAALSEATVAAAGVTTTAAAATTTTAVLAAAPSTDTQFSAVATQDPKAMVRALETAQAPTFVSFQTTITAPPAAGQGSTGTGEATTTTAGSATDTTAAGAPPTTAGPTTVSTVARSGDTTIETVSADQAEALLSAIKEFTGLEPVDRSLWLGGPTFAVFLPRQDAAKLVDLVRSIGAPFGLTVSLGGAPPAQGEQTSTRLLEHKSSFPVLAAHRALQPSTWGYDFTTSTLGYGDTQAMPDEAGTHVVVVIWIAE